MALRAEIERIRVALAAADAQVTAAPDAPVMPEAAVVPEAPVVPEAAAAPPPVIVTPPPDPSPTPKVPFVREYGLRPVEPAMTDVLPTPAASSAGLRPSRRLWVELALVTLVAVLVALVLRAFVAQAYYIPSDSMQPKLGVGDRVVVDKLSYVFHGPRRGDIVIFESPVPGPPDESVLPLRMLEGALVAVGLRQPDNDSLVKRVVALAGDTVQGKDGKLYVNGKPRDEPYLADGTVTSTFGPERVGTGELWVMGDKRATSRDSRTFGPIDRDSVIGRVDLKVWPPSELGRI
jgi:signal peptidase I